MSTGRRENVFDEFPKSSLMNWPKVLQLQFFSHLDICQKAKEGLEPIAVQIWSCSQDQKNGHQLTSCWLVDLDFGLV
jgi:hypothetical protein